MPSNAFTGHLSPLLSDAQDLDNAYSDLRTERTGRGHGLMALNRAAVVICVSAWEAYVEELVRESVESIRPAGPALGLWPTLNATARGAIGRFNTPNTDQVRTLISDTIGLQDIQNYWTWRGCTAAQARARLQEVMNLRHEVAHGVNPRPLVQNRYSKKLPAFFLNLGQCTDAAVRAYLIGTLGIPNPWPA